MHGLSNFLYWKFNIDYLNQRNVYRFVYWMKFKVYIM